MCTAWNQNGDLRNDRCACQRPYLVDVAVDGLKPMSPTKWWTDEGNFHQPSVPHLQRSRCCVSMLYVRYTFNSLLKWLIQRFRLDTDIETKSTTLCSWIYFTWPLRKQAAYKQTARGPMALSPLRGTRQWGYSTLPKSATGATSRFEPGTSRLRVCCIIHWATTPPQVSTRLTNQTGVNPSPLRVNLI